MDNPTILQDSMQLQHSMENPWNDGVRMYGIPNGVRIEHGSHPVFSLHALSLSNMLLLRTTHLLNMQLRK